MTIKQMTGKVNRINGEMFEIKVMKKLNKDPDKVEVIHSAGSFGLIDLLCIRASGVHRAAVCKRNGYLTPRERRKYFKFMENKPQNITVEYWYYKSPKKMKRRVMRKASDFLNLSIVGKVRIKS